MKTQIRSLPRPRRERWQPLRSGLVNLYRYDREEFHYENGRLLLRGNNGTGKVTGTGTAASFPAGWSSRS